MSLVPIPMTLTTATEESTVPRVGGNNGDQFVMLNMEALVDSNTRDPPPPVRRTEDPSVDTTLLARSVGSVVNSQKNAYLRSLTLCVSETYNGEACASDMQWDVTFADPLSIRRMSSSSESVSSLSVSSTWGSKVIQKAKKGLGKYRNKSSVAIASIGGHAALSQIAVGDAVTKINGKKIGPSWNAQRCSDLVNQICSESDGNSNGILSIQTGNDQGLDTVLEATVLKPHPGATPKEMGLEVWWWRGLCVRSVARHSMFEHSGLKMDDELESINGISLTFNDRVTAKDFNRIFEELPLEVTIVVKRSKHRYSGEFE